MRKTINKSKWEISYSTLASIAQDFGDHEKQKRTEKASQTKGDMTTNCEVAV
jgi:hypothetical protein